MWISNWTVELPAMKANIKGTTRMIKAYVVYHIYIYIEVSSQVAFHPKFRIGCMKFRIGCIPSQYLSICMNIPRFFKGQNHMSFEKCKSKKACLSLWQSNMACEQKNNIYLENSAISIQIIHFTCVYIYTVYAYIYIFIYFIGFPINKTQTRPELSSGISQPARCFSPHGRLDVDTSALRFMAPDALCGKCLANHLRRDLTLDWIGL